MSENHGRVMIMPVAVTEPYVLAAKISSVQIKVDMALGELKMAVEEESKAMRDLQHQLRHQQEANEWREPILMEANDCLRGEMEALAREFYHNARQQTDPGLYRGTAPEDVHGE